MTKSIIAAVGREREIGVGNRIPWNLSADRRKFREITTGHAVIMGRKTYESILETFGKPLPNRINIVITTHRDFEAPGCIVVHSIEEAFAVTDPKEEVFIIGGAAIYKQTIPLVDRLYVTKVDAIYPNADAFFPELNTDEWQVKTSTPLTNPEKDPVNATFIIYERG